MTGNCVVTDFSQYSLAQLSLMLDQSDPASCQNAAATWDSTGQALTEQAQNLQVQLSSLEPTWTGTAATDYKQMMTDLVGGIQKVATMAFQMRDLTYDALDALNTARAQMPSSSGAPTVLPGTLTLETTPVQYSSYLSPQVASELEQQQADGQQALASATTPQAQAVAVMQSLAGSYVTAQAAIPPSPDGSASAAAGSSGTTSGAGAPTSSGVLTSSGGASTSGGVSGALLDTGSQAGPPTITLTDTQPSPLFGDMFTIGLAAAAAVAGLGGLLPSAKPAQQGSSEQDAESDGDTASPDPDGAAGTGADGDASVSLADSGAGGSVPDPGAVLGGDAGQAANLAASNAADAAASSASSEPMMPMMPMGGAGAPGLGDSAGGHRIPAWLVEHQDVWGASIPAAPGLIDD